MTGSWTCRLLMGARRYYNYCAKYSSRHGRLVSVNQTYSSGMIETTPSDTLPRCHHIAQTKEVPSIYWVSFQVKTRLGTSCPVKTWTFGHVKEVNLKYLLDRQVHGT